jgi:biopolymer transport protein ExbD
VPPGEPPPPVGSPPIVQPSRTIAEDFAEEDDAEEDDWEEDDADEPRTGAPPGLRRLLGEAAMDMAPMIDVTFLLLIFFMLTNSLANPTAIDVPVAMHGRGVTLEGQQLILVDEGGRYYLGETADAESAAGSLEALVAEVAGNAREAPEPLEVIVSAHRDVRHRAVRELVEDLAPIENLGPIRLGVEEELN